MKKYILMLLVSTLILSCQNDDLSWQEEIESIKIELVNQMKLIEALQANASIISVKQEQGQYTICFSNGQSITLQNGLTPIITIGDNGNWFINGEDTNKPSQGINGVTPIIEIKDGFWSINGIGTDIKAVGVDGCNAPYIVSITSIDGIIYFTLSDGTVYSVKSTSQYRILHIGNSFTTDYTEYLPKLVKELNVDCSNICLYNLICGGSGFKRWVDIYYENASNTYTFKKVLGGLSATTQEYKSSGHDNALIKSVLSEKWDLIIFQQVSTYSNDYSLWNGDTSAGGLREMLQLIYSYQSNVQLGFPITHSSAEFHDTNAEKSSELRWQNIVLSAKNCKQDNNIDFIIPCGTAIQNLRTILPNEAEYTRDGKHLGHGAARYCAACCYYLSVIQPHVGGNIYDSKIVYKCSSVSNLKNPEGCVDVTDDNRKIIHDAAFFANKIPYYISSGID